MATFNDYVSDCHRRFEARLNRLEELHQFLFKLFGDLAMLHLKILSDPRILSAIQTVESHLAPSPMNFLNIITVILTNLPVLLADLGNPAALVTAILGLLGVTVPTGTVTTPAPVAAAA